MAEVGIGCRSRCSPSREGTLNSLIRNRRRRTARLLRNQHTIPCSRSPEAGSTAALMVVRRANLGKEVASAVELAASLLACEAAEVDSGLRSHHNRCLTRRICIGILHRRRRNRRQPRAHSCLNSRPLAAVAVAVTVAVGVAHLAVVLRDGMAAVVAAVEACSDLRSHHNRCLWHTMRIGILHRHHHTRCRPHVHTCLCSRPRAAGAFLVATFVPVAAATDRNDSHSHHSLIQVGSCQTPSPDLHHRSRRRSDIDRCPRSMLVPRRSLARAWLV